MNKIPSNITSILADMDKKNKKIGEILRSAKEENEEKKINLPLKKQS